VNLGSSLDQLEAEVYSGVRSITEDSILLLQITAFVGQSMFCCHDVLFLLSGAQSIMWNLQKCSLGSIKEQKTK